MQDRKILTVEEQRNFLDRVQKAIEAAIPQDYNIKYNTPDSRRNLRLKLETVVEQFKSEYESMNVLCDTTNNNDRVIKDRRMIADIYFILDDSRMKSRIRFEKKPYVATIPKIDLTALQNGRRKMIYVKK